MRSLKILVNFYSSHPTFREECQALGESLLELDKGLERKEWPGIAQFVLDVDLSVTEVQERVDRLGLDGEVRAGQEDDFDESRAMEQA